jgi:hypothetical protein
MPLRQVAVACGLTSTHISAPVPAIGPFTLAGAPLTSIPGVTRVPVALHAYWEMDQAAASTKKV